MDIFCNSENQRLFDVFSGFRPKSFEEYNRVAGKAAKEVLKSYGVVRSEWEIFIPALFNEDILKKSILFGNEEEGAKRTEGFKYKLEREGYIEFFAFSDKDRTLSDKEKEEIEIIFRQLYYVLDILVSKILFKKLMTTDYCTGMANIEEFRRFADEIIAEGKIKDYTALHFNIRNFKAVHRSLTYLEGNEVLSKYGNIVSNAVTKKELVALLGGDSFVAIILNENRDYFFDLIKNMVVTYDKNGKNIVFSFGVTIGAAELSDEKTSGDIIMHINTAYQTAVDNGISMSYYDGRMSRIITERRGILAKFYKSVRERDFFAMYQPKVEVNGNRIIGAEALVRWKGEGRIVMPSEFIPVLEKDGCVCTLDFYMLEEACRLQRKLLDEGVAPVQISVNFSKRHLANNKLVEEITEVVDRYKVPREYIVIELTESEDYRNQEVMRTIVDDLSMHGIKTSIDDFGTGYSSLGMLRTLHFDELKIDKSFVPISLDSGNEKSLLMFKGIVNLAKSLGFSIVVEGVETFDQLKLIKKMGCDVVQGYIFDKPLPEEEFIERIKRGIYTFDSK